MAAYKKSVIKRPISAKETRDTIYWKNLQFPVTIKEFGAVTNLDFMPIEPYNFAVTSSAKVQIYSKATNKVERCFSRFKDVAYSGCFRSDGKLLVAGGEEGVIRLFEATGRVPLRTFKGHRRPVHVTKFCPDNVHLMSCSDDNTVKCWDIATEAQVATLHGHTDYIRTGLVSQANHQLWATGSYDHTVKVFDLRTQASVLGVDHGLPVESILMFPSGGIILSAGGNTIKVWDILAGGRLLATLSNHHKTITSMCFNSNTTRLLSASLDRHVKLYDVATYTVVHSLTYPAPILSMDMAADESCIAVGMADGLLSVRHRKPEGKPQSAQVTKRRLPNPSSRYFSRKEIYQPKPGDFVVPLSSKPQLADYDRHLKKFEHTKALNAALERRVRVNHPEVTVGLMQELIRRKALKVALSGHNEKWLVMLLTFIRKHLTNSSFSATLLDVTNLTLDIYSGVLGQSPPVDVEVAKLRETIVAELKFQQMLLEVMGTMDTLLATSVTATAIPNTNGNNTPLISGQGTQADELMDQN